MKGRGLFIVVEGMTLLPSKVGVTEPGVEAAAEMTTTFLG